MPNARHLLVLLTAMHLGRAMTLGFLPDVGSGLPGAAPEAWMMPLLGDAAIGLTAPLAAWLAWRSATSDRALIAVVAWHAVGAWDAASAWVVHRSVPWPEFFMVQIFGDSMFAMAIAMHLAALWLARRPEPELAPATP